MTTGTMYLKKMKYMYNAIYAERCGAVQTNMSVFIFKNSSCVLIVSSFSWSFFGCILQNN